MILNFDFLVIGSGLAGLYSALEASKYGKVAILTKSSLEQSNSFWAQGGIATAISDDDSPKLHFEDTLTAGRDICNVKAVDVLVNEGKDRILDLINMGMEFDKKGDQLALGMEGGHQKRRVIHAGGDATGNKIIEFLSIKVKENPKISLFENTLVSELIVKDGICRGAYAYQFFQGENMIFFADSTIMATGGTSGIYKRTTNPHTSTGDGITLAYEKGVKIEDLEFIQFHPSAFYFKAGDTFLISEAVRGEGAHLVDVNGKRFMTDIHPLAELAPRDVVAKAIFNVMKETESECVFLKLDHLDEKMIKSRFSNICKEALKYKVDITKDPVPIAPAAHYTIGGIKTGINGETNINHLYACGEVASTGVHGANRLASNSLLECLVFGKRAVEAAKQNIESCPQIINNFKEKAYRINESKQRYFTLLKNKLANVMTEKVGIIRNGTDMKKALEEINEIGNDFDFENDEYYSDSLKSLLTLCSLITQSALMRDESRGAHIRSDFPDQYDGKLYHIAISKGNKPEISFTN